MLIHENHGHNAIFINVINILYCCIVNLSFKEMFTCIWDKAPQI